MLQRSIVPSNLCMMTFIRHHSRFRFSFPFSNFYLCMMSQYEPYPQLRHNAKMAKSVGAFCTESYWEETKSRPYRITREVRIRKVLLHSKIVNKPHQSFLMLSSCGTSRNVIWPSIQSIPLGPHTFRHFRIIFEL